MVQTIFENVLTPAFQFALSFVDQIFDATEMWPIYLGGISIIMILRFIVLPMLMSSVSADGSELSQEMVQEQYDKQKEAQERSDRHRARSEEYQRVKNNPKELYKTKARWRRQDEEEKYKV